MDESAGPATRVTPYRWDGRRLELLDQRRLPHAVVWISCETADDVATAIRNLTVRGAPLIGVAAAFGVALEARRALARGEDVAVAVGGAATRLGATRPTAVNLSAALARQRRVSMDTAGRPAEERADALAAAAVAIADEDRRACRDIAAHGAAWLRARLSADGEPLTVLTHCNAGALATAGVGTALGIVRALARSGGVEVFADETRPFWQGARLTAWELAEDAIPVTILPDVAAASVIASGRVSAVLVGADRIAANGDVANKVGTYGLALACRARNVPFVVAAPRTTLDPATPDGGGIPIETRDGEEVLNVAPAGSPALRVAPAGVAALYPAFDVTPARLVDAIVTEVGVSEPPHAAGLARLLAR